jgi:5-(aminomethyl)-3-furanmethanol phosphate kinase
VTPASLTVVKVGGSLFDWPLLPSRLTAFLKATHERGGASRIVLIAGGGAAVDMIRSLDRIHRLGDQAAHELALHALDLTAKVLASMVSGTVPVDRIELLSEVWNRGLIPILAPRRMLGENAHYEHDRLPASWEVTSDTIAAWVAIYLHAERLVLLKSKSLPAASTLDDAARDGLVDPMLPTAARSLARVEYLNFRDLSSEPCVLVP